MTDRCHIAFVMMRSSAGCSPDEYAGGGGRMFDAEKKAKAVAAVSELCLNCKQEEHSEDCPWVKAMAAVEAMPTN